MPFYIYILYHISLILPFFIWKCTLNHYKNVIFKSYKNEELNLKKNL